jgi:hypothetical protein
MKGQGFVAHDLGSKWNEVVSFMGKFVLEK